MAKEKKEAVEAVTVTAAWEKSSKRFERYLIDGNELGIVGNIYVPKDKSPEKEIKLVFKEKE